MDGVLLDVDGAKKALGIDATVTTDDDYLSDLIADAESAMTRYIGVTIDGVTYIEYFDGGVARIFLHQYPVKSTGIIVVDLNAPSDLTDDETLVEDESYRIVHEEGVVHKINSVGSSSRWILFGSGMRRFKITYTAGLEYGVNWGTEDQNVLRQSIRYMVVDMYNNADPRISQERFGTGTGITIDRAAIPARVREVWDNFKVDVVIG